MAKLILMEEFHLTLFAPRELSEPEYDAIRQALDEAAFQADLARAVRKLMLSCPALSKVRVKISR